MHIITLLEFKAMFITTAGFIILFLNCTAVLIMYRIINSLYSIAPSISVHHVQEEISRGINPARPALSFKNVTLISLSSENERTSQSRVGLHLENETLSLEIGKLQGVPRNMTVGK